MASELGSLIFERLNIDPQRLAEEGSLADIEMKVVEQIFDELLQVLEQGMGSKATASFKRKKAKTSSSTR